MNFQILQTKKLLKIKKLIKSQKSIQNVEQLAGKHPKTVQKTLLSRKILYDFFEEYLFVEN